MFVRWSLHAKHRFAERAVKLGINYGDIEFEIKKQRFKIKEGQNKFKTVFAIQDVMLTAIKLENPKFVHVLTLWESNEKEVYSWKKK